MTDQELTKSTYDSYKRKIELLEENGVVCNNPDSGIFFEALFGYFNKINVQESTQRTYMSAVIWYLKNNKGNKQIIEKLSSEINKVNIMKNNEYEKNELSKREEENYISWDNVLDVFNTINKTNHKRETLMLAFYIYHPPRRIQDYECMYWNNDIMIPDDPAVILWSSPDMVKKYGNVYNEKLVKTTTNFNQKESDRKNYYVQRKDRSYLVFEKYKTFGKKNKKNIIKGYGRQIIEVDFNLDEIIKEYINFAKLKNGDKLINIQHSNYIKKLTKIFVQGNGTKNSASALRHSYITHILSNPKITVGEKKIIANKMAHSRGLQEYYKKNVDDEKFVDNFEGKIKNYENDIKMYQENDKIINDKYMEIKKFFEGVANNTNKDFKNDRDSIKKQIELIKCQLDQMSNNINNTKNEHDEEIKKQLEIITNKLEFNYNKITERTNIKKNINCGIKNETNLPINDKFIIYDKPGRPQKYKTDNEKKIARKLARQRWCEKHKDVVQLYNKQYYEKLKNNTHNN